MSRASVISLFANDLSTSGLSYPESDGLNGQAIITDGNGNLTFGTVDTGGVDSAATLALIDSSYVAARAPVSEKTFFRFTADSGQTSFTGLDISGDTLNYKTKAVEVFLNGIRLADSDDYTATDGSTVSLTTAADSGDDLFITSYTNLTVGGKPPSVFVSNFLYTADSGQTAFTGADSAGANLRYGVDNLLVSINGLLLKPGEDFTATNGTTITLTDAAAAGDEVMAIALQQGVNGAWREVTSNYSISNAEKLIVDTSSAITITLPSSPNFGDEVTIVDGTNNAATNNITVQSAGNILSSSTDFIIDVNRASVTLVYYNATQGWITSNS